LKTLNIQTKGVSMLCERCGHEIAGNSSSVLCPICGTVIKNRAGVQSVDSYVLSSQNDAGEQSISVSASLPTSQTALQPSMQSNGCKVEYADWTHFASDAINAHVMADFTSAYPDGKALVVEFILSLLGIFGIGWLLVGKTRIGFLLLACSILIYWPMMILGTLFTLGFGLMCLGPLAVSCVICNALLLNVCLKRKVARRQ
jgi:hypothetical protein